MLPKYNQHTICIYHSNLFSS